MLTEIIQGIATKLYDATGYGVYTSFANENNEFPCFYVEIVDATMDPALNNQFWVRANCRIHFFYSENGVIDDTNTDFIHEMRYKLPLIVECIYVCNKLIRVRDGVHVKMADDVVVATLSYELLLKKEEIPVETMQILIQKGRIKDGD